MKFALALLVVGTALGQYCGGGNTLPGDSNLGGVTLDVVCGSINDDTDCPGGTGAVDLTDQTAELQVGTAYTLNYDATTCGTLVYPRVTKAWIDFDNSGDFSDDEALGPVQTVPMQVDPQQISFDFTPPCEAAKGEKVRMRIVVVEGGGDPDPCTPFSYGGAKDFSIEILGVDGSACGGKDISRSGECNAARGGGGLDFGGIGLIVIASTAFMYVALGCFFLRYKRGTTGMKESCLGFEFFAAFLSLAREGTLTTKNWVMSKIRGGGGGGSGYEDLEDK